MDPEPNAYIARGQDPALIPGIYNYCDRRCGRCPFTARCFSFREEQEQRRRHGERDLIETVEANFRLATDLMQAWCEREGIDFEKVLADAPEAEAIEQRLADAVDRDPLLVAATEYTHAAYDVVEPLKKLSPFHQWPPGVEDAIDGIAWCAGMISAKISRALHGVAERGRFIDDDPIQNDWNGSAKVARLAIAESSAAWETLFSCGETPPDASIRETKARLQRLDDGLARRFPRAMTFVRPGFDEPEVAAGGLTSLAPFESRRPGVRTRLRKKLARHDWRGAVSRIRDRVAGTKEPS